MLKTRITAVLLTLCLVSSALTLTVSAENSAPIAENLELETFRGVAISGRLSAVDPDGDLVSFAVATPPTKGSVDICEDGTFVYTPEEGKRGRDYFGFKATDAEGNESQEATVVIKLKKQTKSVTYSDMLGDGRHYAALCLAEDGVFVGECLGGEYFFNPEGEITRGDFLVMCLKQAGVKMLSGVTRTGYADDEDIPIWLKSAVSTALINGIITGISDDGADAQFSANDTISIAEAALILDSVLGVTDVAIRADESVPAWAAQAVCNLTACSILPSGAWDLSATVTRGIAAEMLLGARSVLENRAR